MRYYPESLLKLLTELQKLPGIGPKTAQRLAFHLLREPAEDVRRLGDAIARIHDTITHCEICGAITDVAQNPCYICVSPQRDRTQLCLVQRPDDIAIFEKTGAFNGVYHVLGGLLSALNNVRPEDLRVIELHERLEAGGIEEIIFALNPSVEGSATVTFVTRELRPYSLKLTQVAYGIPLGSDLDYVDEMTLSRALEGRNVLA
ncbi:MAG: recombination mediator RecR [Candidatus Poribacteria bacterium]|nr:recombination mediator RecR [Candidatus Poribacteria bacterium]